MALMVFLVHMCVIVHITGLSLVITEPKNHAGFQNYVVNRKKIITEVFPQYENNDLNYHPGLFLLKCSQR